MSLIIVKAVPNLLCSSNSSLSSDSICAALYHHYRLEQNGVADWREAAAARTASLQKIDRLLLLLIYCQLASRLVDNMKHRYQKTTLCFNCELGALVSNQLIVSTLVYDQCRRVTRAVLALIATHAMAVVSVSNTSNYASRTQGKRDGTGRLWEKHNSNSTPSCNVSSSNVSTPLDVRLVDSNYLLQLINEEDAGTLDLDSYLEMYRFLRERITINVSGQVYEIWKDTLERHPDTLLGNPQKRAKYFDRGRQEYFFDRHRPSFDAIFFYYQSGGRLRRPDSIPDDIFLSEIEFFELEKDQIANYKKCEGYVEEKIVLPERPCQRKLWILLEYPESSVVAYVIGIVSVFLTLTSIVLFCIETLPHFSKNDCGENEDETYPDMFFFTETVCTIWFSLEVSLRFCVCPNKWKFFQNFKNLVDLAAVLPYYVTFVNVISSSSCEASKSSTGLAFLRVIRLVRVFKLTKHSAGLQLLVLTFKASLKGLFLFLVALFFCIVLFSSAIYFAETGLPDSQIQSIPDGFWWALITMTTVGYGDRVPVGFLGKVIGSMCAVAGVLTLAIPVPIITENFNKFYAHRARNAGIPDTE